MSTDADTIPSFTAFHNSRRLASGPRTEVEQSVRQLLRETPHASILVFNDETGETIEVPRRESPSAAPRGPGRPKLGVVAREVTLLPRHWDWLNGQPGGASVALRRLVEDARRTRTAENRRRSAQEAVYRFLVTAAGDEPGFEEALRALYRGDRTRFEALTKKWPGDLPAHARKMAAPAFAAK